MTMQPVKVLVVDDSSLVRDILTKGLGADPAIEVVGSAGDPYEARDMIVKLRPQVLTLDIEMPRMTGVEFLKKLMPQFPIPVVMVSSLTERGAAITLDALDAGAVDFVTKPKANVAAGLAAMMLELRTKVKIASTVNVSQWKSRRDLLTRSTSPSTTIGVSSWCKLIAIGASTGGTEALAAVLSHLPSDLPPIVIVQHMPAGFTALFADRMNKTCPMQVKEAADGDVLTRGHAYIAPGSFQMEVVRKGGIQALAVKQGELMCGHAPSVEYLFRSVAQNVGSGALGVILTGMGQDGAHAMKSMRDQGARTIGQDETSCVVYGMPKVAFEVGAVETQHPLDRIAGTITRLVQEAPKHHV